MQSSYDPNSWYWMVGGDTSFVFSSATGQKLAGDDTNFVAWIESGKQPSRISSWSDLYDVLAQRAPEALARSLSTLEASGGLTAQQSLDLRIQQGVTVSSQTDNLLNATYPVNDGFLQKINLINGAISNNEFAGSAGTIGIQDITGTAHNFSVAQFQSFVSGLHAYLGSLYSAEGVALAGGSANWPTGSVQIA